MGWKGIKIDPIPEDKTILIFVKWYQGGTSIECPRSPGLLSLNDNPFYEVTHWIDINDITPPSEEDNSLN